jgi:hypothetical protein
MDLFTEPGTLDLAPRVPSHPGLADEVAASWAWCDELGHVPVTDNLVHDLTYCGCGLVTYPGDHGELPLPRALQGRTRRGPMAAGARPRGSAPRCCGLSRRAAARTST